MNTKLAGRILAALLFLCAVAPGGVTNAFAGVEPMPWLPTTGGYDNPIFWVLFNPQPEPPGYEMKATTNTQGELVFTSPYGKDGLGLLFGASGPVDNIVSSKTAGGFSSLLYDGTVLMFTADFTFESGGMLFPGSAVAFNPQPEPPGAPDVHVWITFDLLDSAGGMIPMGSEVNMTMHLTDANGQLISLMPGQVPEPALMLLFGAGLAGLGMLKMVFRS